jgi:hypothetical protein
MQLARGQVSAAVAGFGECSDRRGRRESAVETHQ